MKTTTFNPVNLITTGMITAIFFLQASNPAVANPVGEKTIWSHSECPTCDILAPLVPGEATFDVPAELTSDYLMLLLEPTQPAEADFTEVTIESGFVQLDLTPVQPEEADFTDGSGILETAVPEDLSPVIPKEAGFDE